MGYDFASNVKISQRSFWCPNLKQIDQILIELTIAFVSCGTIVSLLGFEGGNFDRKSFNIIREIKWDKTIVNDSSLHYSTILVLFLEFVAVDRAEMTTKFVRKSIFEQVFLGIQKKSQRL